MFSRSLFLAATVLVAVKSEEQVPPCEYIATLLSQGATSFPAGQAFDCLNSVSVNKEGNKKLIEELKIAWQWYGEMAWQKNPPEGWDAVDIIADLDQIKDNMDNFQSEYEVQLAIQEITLNSGDWSLEYIPDILQVFGFERDFSLVALSDDGLAVPKLYVTFDALKVADGNITEDKISEITKINGDEPWAYLENLTYLEPYMDLSSSLNNLLAQGNTINPGSFMFSSYFDGGITNVTFANGTEIEFMNSAWTNEDFTGVTNGKTFYDKFCTGKVFVATDSKENKRSIQKRTTEGSTIHSKRDILSSRFPDPVVSAKSGAVAGYFLEGEDYDDVAVLKAVAFETEEDKYGFEFQQVVSDFLKKCEEEGKNRLILDLRENTGGSTQIYVDLFMQLFPHRQPWQGARYRATPHFKLMGDAFNEIQDNKDIAKYYKEMWNTTIEKDLRFWAYPHFLDAQNKEWENWEQFKGPELFHDDQFTRTMRYNFSNDEVISVLEGGFQFTVPSGHETPFNHTNIVMFTDALCGGACAALHEELKNNGGIKSIVVGGRAEEGWMSAVSGSKSGETLNLRDGIARAEHLRNVSRKFDLKSYPADEATLDEFIDMPELKTRASGGEAVWIPFQANMRKGDKTSTPLNFVEDVADCRIFYTRESFANAETAWKQVWNAFLEPEKKCVEGSTKHNSSISGGFVPYGPWTLKDEDLPVPQDKQADKTGSAAPAASSKPADFEGAGSKMSAPVAALLVTVVGMMIQF